MPVYTKENCPKILNDSNLVEDEDEHWVVRGPKSSFYEIGVISQTAEKSLFAQFALNNKGKRKNIRLVLVYWNQNIQ